MDASRASLAAKFLALDDFELSELYRSGELTELASDVAREELARRGLDTSATAPSPQSEPEVSSEPLIQGDLVMVARLLDATEAEMLRGRLEAEGVSRHGGRHQQLARHVTHSDGHRRGAHSRS
jgi:hypothetical protein